MQQKQVQVHKQAQSLSTTIKNAASDSAELSRHCNSSHWYRKRSRSHGEHPACTTSCRHRHSKPRCHFPRGLCTPNRQNKQHRADVCFSIFFSFLPLTYKYDCSVFLIDMRFHNAQMGMNGTLLLPNRPIPDHLPQTVFSISQATGVYFLLLLPSLKCFLTTGMQLLNVMR